MNTEIVERNGRAWEITRHCTCTDNWCETYIGTAIAEAIVFGSGCGQVRIVSTTGNECTVAAERWLW